MDNTLAFVIGGWWTGLCLWFAVRIAEGDEESNPPLLALAIGFGFAAGESLLGSLGLALPLGVLFVLLITVYRLSMPATLLTCVLLFAIQLALVAALAALLAAAGPWAAIGLLVVLAAASLRWWWHDLSLFGAWMRQRGEGTYAKAKTNRARSPRKPRVPRARTRRPRKPVATEGEQAPAAAPASPKAAESPPNPSDDPRILR